MERVENDIGRGETEGVKPGRGGRVGEIELRVKVGR
jgi:hypothetical protein